MRVVIVLLIVSLSACATTPHQGNVWLLISNPRFGDAPREPQYVWVEEDKLPITMTTLLNGKDAIVAPPEIVAKYGTPPGRGRISPRQGGVPEIASPPPPATLESVPLNGQDYGQQQTDAAMCRSESLRGLEPTVPTWAIVIDGILMSAVGLVTRAVIPLPVASSVVGVRPPSNAEVLSLRVYAKCMEAIGYKVDLDPPPITTPSSAATASEPAPSVEPYVAPVIAPPSTR